MQLRQRVPEPLIGPLGVLSLIVGLIGLVIGYIITMVGITAVYNLNGLAEQGLAQTDAYIVVVVGLAFFGLAYAGYRGFMTFAT